MDNLAELFQESERRRAQVTAYYRVLKEAKKLNNVLVSSYYCDDGGGCLLLHIFQTPIGLAFFLPKYKLSRAENESSSNAEGRANNTDDGDRKWTFQSDALPASGNLTLNCDHVRNYVLEMKGLVTGKPGAPLRRVVST
jgi:hypothetical protein